MSGNCATGIRVMAMSPASVMTMEMTKARRGRSMKIAEITGLVPAARRQHRDLHRLVGANLLDAVDDDAVTFLQTRGDDDIRPLVRPQGDPAELHFVRAIDDQDIG